MSIPSWLRSPRIRRGLAVSAVVLSAGGLVLFRASGGSASTIHPILMSSTPTRAPFSGPGAHGTFSLSNSRLLAGGDRDLYAEVRFIADPGAGQQVRAPLSMAIVLDTSGSMDGEKMEDAKSSVMRLIRDMRDDDEVSLVRYSDSASIVQPMSRVGRVRDDLISKVRNLSAGGGTAIPLGLSQGMSTLEDAGKGRVRRVVLVSDGLDSSRAAAERLARESFGKGVTVSSLGIGLDFDESYMSGLSAVGHGNFGFVKNAGSLSAFLQRELSETASTTIQGAKVRVKLPAGVRATRASGAEMKEIGDDEIELQLGSLFSGDERRVLIEMTAHMETDAKAFEGAASWNLVGGAPVEAGIARLTVSPTYEPTDVEASRDGEVMANAVSVVASKRQLEAAEAFQRGDVQGAQNLIDKNMNDLKSAQAFAPPAAATALQKQEAAYGGTKRVFSTAKPKSAEGNAAAKGVFEKDVSNMDRAAY